MDIKVEFLLGEKNMYYIGNAKKIMHLYFLTPNIKRLTIFLKVTSRSKHYFIISTNFIAWAVG